MMVVRFIRTAHSTFVHPAHLIGFCLVDPLSWLGLRKSRNATTHLSIIHELMRELLPEDESVVVRYIVVVAILLTRVAHADGRVVEAELARLRALFEHIDRMPPEGIDRLCDVLDEHAPKLSGSEMTLCFGELKALCDGAERRQVLRLLASQASADGEIHDEEHRALVEVGSELGIAEGEVVALEEEAMRSSRLPVAPGTIPPPRD
jgi:DnaJ like chaperone protein